jgi:type II secretory pathway predicted ATPase ExeA
MYNNYFGFSESPFSVTPDPNFFYTNPVYREAYANLRYGIESKKGFIVLTGEVGTGKTTLLRKLMRSSGDTIHSVFIFNTDLTFSELLPFILDDLGLAPQESSKVTMLHELNNYLIKQLERGHIVAVLVDEAQNLSDEALEGLRLLSNLETDQEKLLQIVLMGQPELETKLDQPTLRQLKQRVALRGRLAPLKDEEVGAYIDFRLKTAGYEGAGLFHSDAVQAIARHSKGIPRSINIICDNALLNAFARSQETISADIIKEAASDLKLNPESQLPEAKITPALSTPKTEPKMPVLEATNDVSPHRVRGVARAGIETFLVILAFIAIACVVNPQSFLLVTQRSFEVAKRNLNQWMALVTEPATVPKKISPETELKWEDHRITIEYGSNIYKIASDAYGANAPLGIDLIREYNPQIKSLNRVFAGEGLLLPPLTQQTLLRKQSDGSYHLIVASFYNRTGADEYARLLSRNGYQATITPRRLSDELLLYRVEIDGLKNFEQASQIWETGRKSQWLALAGNLRQAR